MHIPDGPLSDPVWIGGLVLAAGGLAMGVRRLDLEAVPATGVLAATFFVASLVHVPLGFSSVHLIMGGLAGLVLGWVAFPALFVGLLLQSVFFGFGGLTAIGVNTFNIALPAVIVYYLFRPGVVSDNRFTAVASGFAAGFSAIALTAILVGVALYLSGGELIAGAWIAFAGHIPVMIVEGFVCAAAVALIRQVRPELFGVSAPGARRAGPRRIWAANTSVVGLVVGVPLGYLLLPASLRPGAVLESGMEIGLADIFVDSVVAAQTGPYFAAAAIGGAIVFAAVGWLVGPLIEGLSARREAARGQASMGPTPGAAGRP